MHSSTLWPTNGTPSQLFTRRTSCGCLTDSSSSAAGRGLCGCSWPLLVFNPDLLVSYWLKCFSTLYEAPVNSSSVHSHTESSHKNPVLRIPIRDVYPGFRIRIFSITDSVSRVKKIPGSGSWCFTPPGSRGQKGTGSAKLQESTQNVKSLKVSVTQRTIIGQMLPIIFTLIGDLFKLWWKLGRLLSCRQQASGSYSCWTK
jgi:hypothetical protein